MAIDCWFCRQEPKCRCQIDDGLPKIPLILPKDKDVLSIECFSGVAFAVASMGVSREAFIDWATTQLYNERYVFYSSDGVKRFYVGDTDIYKAFNDDCSFRWLTDLVEYANRPLLQKPHQTHLLRLQLIILALMVGRPDLANTIFNPDTIPPPKGAV